MCIGLLGGLGGRDRRIGLLCTVDLYLDFLGGDLPPKDGMAVGGGSDLQGTIDESEGLSCDFGESSNFVSVLSLLAPVILCPLVGSNGGIIL